MRLKPNDVFLLNVRGHNKDKSLITEHCRFVEEDDNENYLFHGVGTNTKYKFNKTKFEDLVIRYPKKNWTIQITLGVSFISVLFGSFYMF